MIENTSAEASLHLQCQRGNMMLDIENAVDSSATDDEFEEIIMGLIITQAKLVVWLMAR